MANRLQISIQILKEATAELWAKLNEAKKEERAIISEVNRKKDEEKINQIKNKLGI